MSWLGFLGGTAGGFLPTSHASIGGILADVYTQQKAQMFPSLSSILRTARQRTGKKEGKVKKNGLGKFPKDEFSWEENFKEAYK